MPTVGEILQAERKMKGISIAEVSSRTHIRSAFLTALEQSDYEALPSIGHTKGFVISYAQCLGLDANALARQVAEELSEPGPAKGRGAFDRAKSTNRTSTDTHEIPWRLVWILVAVVVVSGALFWGLSTFLNREATLGPRAPIKTISTIVSGEETATGDATPRTEGEE